MTHPVEQQDSQQGKKQADNNAICVHKGDPSSRVPHCPQEPQIAGARALRARLLQEACADPSFAEKPKVGELQMDWLRSEDLKEVKVITAPNLSITLKCYAHASAISRNDVASVSGSEESRKTSLQSLDSPRCGASPIL
jgi:hypothetical protein